MTDSSDWLLAQGSELGAEQLLDGLARSMIAKGFPLMRVSTSLLTLHPEVYVRNLVWTREEGTSSMYRLHDYKLRADYTNSPVAAIHQGAASVRGRLEGPPAEIGYPILVALAKQGATDYLALPLVFEKGRRSYVSFTTDRAGGFTDEHIQELERLLPVLSLRFALESANYTTRCLLEVYLGPNAAKRVLAGAFRRGGGEMIRAAIFTCDMRGFTAMSDRLPAREVVAVLDRYFEGVAVPVEKHGGEVLKFIGDAVLAIFPIESDPGDACRRALAAAEEGLAALQTFSADVGVGLALHVGEVMYGNIGAPGRLDFTVIGAAVNETCRVESLCKTLDVPLLMTATFAAACGDIPVVSLGRHALKGVKEPVEIRTLSRLSASSAPKR